MSDPKGDALTCQRNEFPLSCVKCLGALGIVPIGVIHDGSLGGSLMPEQSKTPSVFRWAALIGTFVAAFVVLKTVFAVALTVLFYGVVGLVAAGVAVQVVKKLNS